MGFFDMFRRNKSTESQSNSLPYIISFGKYGNKDLKVEFQEKGDENTTRLVVCSDSIKIADQEVYKCLLSHYNNALCEIFDSDLEGFIGRKDNYITILANIDVNLLQSDDLYCEAVIKNLLNKKRLLRYMDMALQENPEVPCGIYVGGVCKIGMKYRNYFNVDIGKACHNSSYMQKIRRKILEQKNKTIKEEKQLVSKLNDENDNIR